MNFLSLIKSVVLTGADSLNAAVGGPQKFTRAAVPDPSATSPSDWTRRDAIAAAAEKELEGFVRNGAFMAQKPNDLGDAAIWQGVYAAMTVLRWRTDRTSLNWSKMLLAADALSAYLHKGVLCRGAVPADLEGPLFHRDPTKTYRDEGGYVYREDASLDSLLGVMFGAAIINRFSDDDVKAVIATPLVVFAKRFESDGFRLTNSDGSVTTYGDCRPGFAQAPVRVLAAALPSLVSGHGDAWRKIAAAHGPEFATTDTQVPGRISYVNAHLAMLANLTYVAAAPSGAPGLDRARDGLRSLMAKYADAGNAFVINACAFLSVAPNAVQREKAARVLIEFPLGPKPRAGLNSSEASSLQPVPVWQRPPSDYIFQRSPYPYSGSESHDYTRLDYLLAHYLDRAAVKETR